jgi:hypothetical protein
LGRHLPIAKSLPILFSKHSHIWEKLEQLMAIEELIDEISVEVRIIQNKFEVTFELLAYLL